MYISTFCQGSPCSSAGYESDQYPYDVSSIPGLAQRVKDLALLWLWRRPAANSTPSLETSTCCGVALKSKKKKKIWCCHCCGTGSIPGSGTLHATGAAKKRRKEKRKERKRIKHHDPILESCYETKALNILTIIPRKR